MYKRERNRTIERFIDFVMQTDHCTIEVTQHHEKTNNSAKWAANCLESGCENSQMRRLI